MFGDMMGMMGKLKETQRKVEETKKRMDTVLLTEKYSDNQIEITITANREIKNIEISDNLLSNKDELASFLKETINKAIQQATKVNEAELAAVAKDGMPNIPGLNSLFK